MENQERLSKQIKLLSDSIRKKARVLKSNINERDVFLESTFKPVVGPLKEISKKISGSELERLQMLPEVKQEKYDDKNPMDTDTSDDMETEEEPSVNEEERSDVEETPSKSRANVVKTSGSTRKTTPSRLSILATDIANKGPLTRKYVLKMLQSAPPKRKYHVYGARLEEKQGLMIGDSKLSIDSSDNLNIKNKVFKGSPGLFELVFTNDPKTYDAKDLNTFKIIIQLTNAHKKNYSPSSPVYRNTSVKYKNVISRIFPIENASPSGRGLKMKSTYETNVIYYNDINKLVDRMRLLYEAKNAGHTGLDNEIVALTEELRNKGYIL